MIKTLWLLTILFSPGAGEPPARFILDTLSTCYEAAFNAPHFYGGIVSMSCKQISQDEANRILEERGA